MLPPSLRDLAAFLREFNELQLDLLRSLCCDRARVHPLLADLVARIVEHEQRRRYRGDGPTPPFDEGLAAEPATAAAEDALRIAEQVPQQAAAPARLTCAELLPVGVFLELLGARLQSIADRQPATA